MYMGINNYISTAIVFKKCYKKKTCEEGGYYSSEPTDQKCSPMKYNGYTCYYSCSYKTCSDYGYEASIPSGQTCTTINPRPGLTCYKDCKAVDEYYTMGILVNRQDRCTITISGSLREASAYTGTVQLSVRYNKRNCNSYNNGVGETETVTLSFPYQTQHRYMMSSCTMDTNGNCTVYVAGVNIICGTYGANSSTYNGKKIKIDLQNQGG